MPEFTQSWVFAFLLGCVIGGCFGVVIAAILATSSKASRMEERIERDLASRPLVVKVKNHFKSKEEIVTQNNPRTD